MYDSSHEICLIRSIARACLVRFQKELKKKKIPLEDYAELREFGLQLGRVGRPLGGRAACFAVVACGMSAASFVQSFVELVQQNVSSMKGFPAPALHCSCLAYERTTSASLCPLPMLILWCCSASPAAAEPRLRYYDLTLGNGAQAQDGSRVVVSTVRWRRPPSAGRRACVVAHPCHARLPGCAPSCTCPWRMSDNHTNVIVLAPSPPPFPQVHFDCKFRGLSVVSTRSARTLGGNRTVAEVRPGAVCMLVVNRTLASVPPPCGSFEFAQHKLQLSASLLLVFPKRSGGLASPCCRSLSSLSWGSR